jgi:hypothetical protein
VRPADGGRLELTLPTAPNGIYDPDLEVEPDGGALWMAYSGVDGPPGSGLVSTHLARSLDRGLTWCELGVVNQATRLVAAELPPGVAADGGHWNHETPAISYDPAAPASERWRLLWHRYLYANLPDGGDGRLFEYGWVAERAAASAEALASAPEHKLLSTIAYHVTPAIEGWNNAAPGGLPRQNLSSQLPCLGAAEPSLLARGGRLFLALFCFSSATQQDIVLLELNRATNRFDLRGRLLGAPEATQFNALLTTFNGADLVARGPEVRLLVSPVLQTLYAGCLSYPVLDLNTATVAQTPTFGIAQTAGVGQTGACTWHDQSVLGVISGDVLLSGVQFRLYGNGPLP